MNSIFLSYRFTGEDPQELEDVLGKMTAILEGSGNHVTCSFFYEEVFQKQRMTTEQIYNFMLLRQEECDTFLAFVKSEERSEGMARESRKAVELGQRYVLAMKSGLHIPEYCAGAREIITFSDYPGLFDRLRQFHW